MTRAEIDRVCELFAHRGYIPVPLSEWREFMATKVKATIKDGKVKPKDTTPAPLRKAKAMKAARTEKGLRANREKRK